MAHTTPRLRRMWTICKKILVEDGNVDELQRTIRQGDRSKLSRGCGLARGDIELQQPNGGKWQFMWSLLARG
jgi:hypothetical protein